MKKNTILFAFIIFLLILMVTAFVKAGAPAEPGQVEALNQPPAQETPLVRQTDEAGDENDQHAGYISYVRHEIVPQWVNDSKELILLYRLFIMNSQGEDIIMLRESTQGMAHAWSGDGRLLAISSFTGSNLISIWDFENRFFYREQAFDLSNSHNNYFQIKGISPGYNDYTISYLAWWNDQKGLDAILQKDDEVLFCSLQIPENMGGYDKSFECQNFREMIGNIPFDYFISFKRNPTDQRLLVVLLSMEDAGERTYNTYLFNPATRELE